MKIRFKKPDEKGAVTVVVSFEMQIVPAEDGSCVYVMRDGRAVGTWSSLEIAKKNIHIDAR